MSYAYIAGILDGEGSVCIINRRSLQLSVTNSSRAIIDYLHQHCGGHIKVQKKYKPHHKQCWVWHLRGDKVLSLLEKLLPSMLEESKVERAKILVNEWKQKTPRNGKYSPQQLIEKDEMVDRFLSWA